MRHIKYSLPGYPSRLVVKNYPGSLLPGYPTGTRVPAAALHSGI